MIVSTNKVFPLDESPITTFNPGDSTTSISIFSFSKFTDLRYSAQYSGLVELYFNLELSDKDNLKPSNVGSANIQVGKNSLASELFDSGYFIGL